MVVSGVVKSSGRGLAHGGELLCDGPQAIGVSDQPLGGRRWARLSGNMENLCLLVLRETCAITACGELVS